VCPPARGRCDRRACDVAYGHSTNIDRLIMEPPGVMN
jgi:hypothetical protein